MESAASGAIFSSSSTVRSGLPKLARQNASVVPSKGSSRRPPRAASVSGTAATCVKTKGPTALAQSAQLLCEFDFRVRGGGFAAGGSRQDTGHHPEEVVSGQRVVVPALEDDDRELWRRERRLERRAPGRLERVVHRWRLEVRDVLRGPARDADAAVDVRRLPTRGSRRRALRRPRRGILRRRVAVPPRGAT